MLVTDWLTDLHSFLRLDPFYSGEDYDNHDDHDIFNDCEDIFEKVFMMVMPYLKKLLNMVKISLKKIFMENMTHLNKFLVNDDEHIFKEIFNDG